MNQGKYVIALMLLVGLVAAAISLWHHRNVSRQALEYWGHDSVRQILRSEKVIAVRFAKDGNTPPIADAEHDASESRGLGNIRQALLQDAAYEWNDRQPADKTIWQYGLRFESADVVVTALISTADQRIGKQGHDESIALDPSAVRVLQGFLDEQFNKPHSDSN